MENHEEMMRAALCEAQAAERENEVPVGAVISRNGVILARAGNARERDVDPTAHAEMLAIRTAARALGTRRLHGCTLYVTMEPCPMCAGAMMMAELDACFFGAPDRKQGCCESIYALPSDPAFFHRVSCCGGLLEEECSSILKKFFAEKREARNDRH